MSKGRMAEIVCKADSLNKIRIDKKRFVEEGGGLFQKRADGSTDLSDFKRVGQPSPIKVELTRKKHLSLCLEPPKSRAVDDAVAVCLKRTAVNVRLPRLEAFDVKIIVEGIQCQRPHETPSSTQGREAATKSSSSGGG